MKTNEMTRQKSVSPRPVGRSEWGVRSVSKAYPCVIDIGCDLSALFPQDRRHDRWRKSRPESSRDASWHALHGRDLWTTLFAQAGLKAS